MSGDTRAWTREEHTFVSRIARAAGTAGLRDRGLGKRDHEMWIAFVACSSLWGPRSAPALGCVLALVREAWGSEFYVQVTAYEGGALIVVATPGGGVAHEADCSSIGQGLVEALEAAP